MTDQLISFPDIEMLVVDNLKDRSELDGALVDNRLPAGFDGTRRAVFVSRSGGVWTDDDLDQALIDLEVYAPDKPAAHLLSLAARGLVLQLEGTSYGGALVTDVREEDGPRWLPDYVHGGVPRYRSTTRLSVRPL